MPTNSELPIGSIVSNAAEWYIRCTGDELTVTEDTEVHQWLAASPVHVAELVHMLNVDSALQWHFNPIDARSRLDNDLRSLRMAFQLAGVEPASDIYRSNDSGHSQHRAARPTVDQMRNAGVFGGIILAVVLGVVRSPEDIEKYPALSLQPPIQQPAATDAHWIGASVVTPQESTPHGVIIVSDPVQFTGIVQAIERNPRLIYDLPWRQWEEIIAAAWERFGYRVELTPRSADGGRDVIATRNEGVAIRIFDQVKSRAVHRVVTADEVRSMIGTFFMERNVSKAFVTTTTEFAKGVYENSLIQQFVPYRLELRSRLPLVSWLSQARDFRVH